MFEREIRDVAFTKRWSIVRTLRDQSVAEHSYNVAMYANDIAAFLDIDPRLHLGVVQAALWHDVDEIFSGDMPGPNKRALIKDRESWDQKLKDWMRKTFGIAHHRDGSWVAKTSDATIVKLIVKVADWLDAALEMATESQLGNQNTDDHIDFNHEQALETLDLLAQHVGAGAEVVASLKASIGKAVVEARVGRSAGPRITRPPKLAVVEAS